ncbi:MAG: hypothetical protein JWP64_2369 [Pseudonocardia sp.]|nr:hypothetical protein [Pseudonocardia sp.]MDT7698234.1 hypothetical protein [Pseudonocardiales bacterium]
MAPVMCKIAVRDPVAVIRGREAENGDLRRLAGERQAGGSGSSRPRTAKGRVSPVKRWSRRTSEKPRRR